MKKTLGMLMGVLLVLVCMGASAQDYVSVTELYEQAQAMGGVWQESFDAPNGQVTVDAPIIVPNVETMPVLTMEGAKISEELYHHIIQGRKGGSQQHRIRRSGAGRKEQRVFPRIRKRLCQPEKDPNRGL